MGVLARLRNSLHSVDNILSDFDLAVTRLENAVKHHNTVADNAAIEAARHDAIAAAAVAEAKRATKVADKVKALIS